MLLVLEVGTLNGYLKEMQYEISLLLCYVTIMIDTLMPCNMTDVPDRNHSNTLPVFSIAILPHSATYGTINNANNEMYRCPRSCRSSEEFHFGTSFIYSYICPEGNLTK